MYASLSDPIGLNVREERGEMKPDPPETFSPGTSVSIQRERVTVAGSSIMSDPDYAVSAAIVESKLLIHH